MLYITRDDEGRIASISVHETPGSEELTSVEEPDVLDFLTQTESEENVQALLTDYDASIPRVLEDLIDILIRDKIIQFSEFPDEAKRKLLTRQYLRNVIRQVDRLRAEKQKTHPAE